MTQEALKLALEALELSAVTVDSFGVQKKTNQAITAIKEALAQTQEPVACAECERLKDALKRANGLAEHFERAWYLRGDEIELLKAQTQEPVGVVHHKLTSTLGADYEQVAVFVRPVEPGTKLYTTQPQRTWVGLTDEDKKQITRKANYHWEMTTGEYAERIGELTEAKLKELNT